MIFLNISTDYVQILHNSGEKLIFRNQVEYELWPTLVQLFNSYHFTKVMVINGPGGFTNLRVGALCLNLLKTLEDRDGGRLIIQEISKIALFDFAVQKGILPNLWAIYIGQKKTLWLYNFAKKSSNLSENYVLVKREDLPYTQDNIFFDKVYDEEYFTEDITSREIKFLREDKGVVMYYNQHKLSLHTDQIPRKNRDVLEANYMVQPVLG